METSLLWSKPVSSSRPGIQSSFRRGFIQAIPATLRRTSGLLALAATALSITAAAQAPGSPFPGNRAFPQARHAATPATSTVPQAATPQFSVTPGVYAGTQTVSITDTTPGATIYYTTNGAYPSTYSTKFSSPITVSTSEVIVAYAAATGYVDSTYGVGRYIISSAPSSFIYSIAGNGLYGYSGDGGLATAAQLQPVQSLAVDAAGNVYFVDPVDDVIRKITKSTGIITTIAGTGVEGDTGDGGPATSATLNYPFYLAVDGLGNLYIGEQNGKIRLISASNGQISTYASLSSINGMAVDRTNDLYATDGVFVHKFNAQTGVDTRLPQNSYPFMGALAVDAQGNVYFTEEWSGLVAELNAQTGAITTVAGGNNFPGSGLGDGGPATSATLRNPSAIGLDGSGNLFILDSGDCAIRKVQNSIINTVAGNGNCYSAAGDGDPALSAGLDTTWISNFAVGATGQIYLSMTLANDARLWEITPPALPPTTSLPAPTFSVAAGTYDQPQTITASDSVSGANIYLSTDGNPPMTNLGGFYIPVNAAGTMTVTAVASAPGYLPSALASAKYTITVPPDSLISTIAGDGRGSSISMTGGPALSTPMDYPAQAVADSAGNLYIPDSFYDVVWKVSASTGNLTVFAGLGPGNWGSAGDGGPATSAEFVDPVAVAVDQAGNVYIADSAGNRVRKVAAGTGIITTVAGGGNGLLGDGGPATSATLSNPYSVVLDSAGNLYIADMGHDRVRVVSAATGIISTYAGNGTITGPAGDGGAAINAVLLPYSIALDATGNLYITDTFHNTLRKVDAASGNISTIAGNGTAGFAGDGGPATAAQVGGSLAIDAQGNIYISAFAEVRKIDAKTGIISSVAGTKYLGYGGDGGAAEAASLRSPWGLSFDGAGNLYIADAGNGVIRRVTFFTPAATPTFTPAAGAYTGVQSVTLSDSTANAAIYYTTDGSTPDTTSTKYTGAITVAQNETINAIAVASGSAESAVATAKYAITIPTPSIALTASINPVFTQNPVTFTATLTSAYGTPTGTVNFLDGSSQIGSGTLSNGVATFTTSSLTVGAHSITAIYGGDMDFTSVTSAALTETVADFTFAPPSGGSTSATASWGGTATYSLTVTPPSGGSASPITFSISGLPTGATATFNPASVPANSGTTNVTLTIQLPASADATPHNVTPFGGAPLFLGFVLLPFLGMRRFRRALSGKLLIVGFVLIGLAGLGGAVGCGGSGSGSSGTSNPQPQNYTLTVTATAGTLSHTETLTLNVQ